MGVEAGNKCQCAGPRDPETKVRIFCSVNRQSSVIVISQRPLKHWHAQFQDPTLADAIRDRLVHYAEIVELTGESMRKRKPSNGDKPETAA